MALVAGVCPATAARWRRRRAKGLGVQDARRSGRKRLYDRGMEDRVIAFHCQSSPLPGHGRWSLRWAAAEMARRPGLVGGAPSRSTMQRMLDRHKMRPHRNRYFLQLADPDFFPKMERLVALYANPPKNLFCFDECPGVQVLRRIAPDMRPGDGADLRLWWKEFEYIRNGTTDLFAFLDVRTGAMSVRCHPCHTKEVFVAEFRAHAARLPAGEPAHYVMDNLDSHCCLEFCQAVADLSGVERPPAAQLASQDARREWLQRRDKRIAVQFTPTHGSWLNMAETCFRLIGEKCLRDSYASPDELHSAVHAFVEVWNERWAHPFNWGYDGEGLHRKAVQRFTAMLGHDPGKMTLQFLSKCCQLMCNLFRDYKQEVEADCWQGLWEAMRGNVDTLWESIRGSDQPKVKKNAEQALKRFLETMPANEGQTAGGVPRDQAAM